jgi:hypothetical protein
MIPKPITAGNTSSTQVKESKGEIAETRRPSRNVIVKTKNILFPAIAACFAIS